jgi:8-oxo-dGTP pyrophosphatase MutT (NUDIX family)
MLSNPSPFLRHLQQCNTANPAATRAPFSLAGVRAGWIAPVLFTRLTQAGLGSEAEGFNLPEPAALEELGEQLAAEGFYTSHHELFDVSTDADCPAIARIDRGALPLFGLVAAGVHMNGLVRTASGLHLWTGRRAANKRLDPAKLDHLVAGGIPAGHTPDEALAKEAAEEASIAPALIASAQRTARIVYALDRPEGLRRDVLYCYDLYLPADFTPVAADGEVESFTLMPIEEAFRIVRDTDDFKFNVNLVLIDLFLRHGLIDPDSTEGGLLRAGLTYGLSSASPGHAARTGS